MAVKRISRSSINWKALAECVPPHQRSQFKVFKSRSDQYLKDVLDYPEKPPEIDWSFYKSRVPVPGMVDDFRKQYAALKVPYPADTVTGQIEAQEKEMKVEMQKFKRESDIRIAQYKKDLERLAAMIPFDQMTMEDFRDAYPDIALDPINRPTFWPHTPEDQPDHAAVSENESSKH